MDRGVRGCVSDVFNRFWQMPYQAPSLRLPIDRFITPSLDGERQNCLCCRRRCGARERAASLTGLIRREGVPSLAPRQRQKSASFRVAYQALVGLSQQSARRPPFTCAVGSLGGGGSDPAALIIKMHQSTIISIGGGGGAVSGYGFRKRLRRRKMKEDAR